MATKEHDHVTGQDTTGHEWDGIKELNTPLPKWWVYAFYACIVWSIGYWVLYPAWPSLSGYTKGLLGYSTRAELAADMEELKKVRGAKAEQLAQMDVNAIYVDPDMRSYAIAAGRTAFNENCSACHQMGGAGAVGYPTLADDEWIWGGTLDDIKHTIAFGVRNANAESRQGEMPKFGADDMLTPEQIDAVAEYVVALSQGAADAAAAGAAVFAENCAACHGEAGEGQPALGAPALNNGLWLYDGSKDAVVAQISAPKHGSMPAWSERLDESTIKQLAVYVRSLGGGK